MEITSGSMLQEAQPPTFEARSSELGKDSFLKLLIAQLRHQDPLSPADSTDFIAQSAQFTMVEKLNEIADGMAGQVQFGQLSAIGALVGSQVEFENDTGGTARGEVTSARIEADGVFLRVGDDEVRLDDALTFQTGSPTPFGGMSSDFSVPMIDTASLALAAQTPTRASFATQVLAGIGAPASEGNLAALASWMNGESTAAVFNPFATTWGLNDDDADNYNSVGVQNYPDFATGVRATVSTLSLSFYDQITAALRSGSTPSELVDLVVASPWGTQGFGDPTGLETLLGG